MIINFVLDQNGKSLSKPLQNIPSKKKQPQYYDFIPEPIDLQTIERFINTGTYSQPDQFDRDVLKTFQNAIRFYGQHSLEGSAALKLRKVYNNIKGEYIESLSEIIGSDIPEKASIQAFKSTMFKTDGEDEERIECLCGQYKDEGLMIQCEKCHVWQHCDCVGQTGEDESESYLCPKCGEREAVLDIPLVPQPEYASPGEKYFVSLSRCENLQVRVGDTVYVLRAFKNKMEHDSTSGNEGLLKIATAKPSPKKKSTGKRKEKHVAQKADTVEERKNANNDEPLECAEAVALPTLNMESTNTALPIQDASDDQQTSIDNNRKENKGDNKEQPSAPADKVKNKSTTEEKHAKDTANDNEKKPIGSATEVSVIETESKSSEHETHPVGEEPKAENSTLTNVGLTEHSNATADENLSNSELEKESMNVDVTTDSSNNTKTGSTGCNQPTPPPLTPPHVVIDLPLPSVDNSLKPETEKKKKEKDQFCHGGIPHKMMSPTKGPALEASSLAQGSYPTYKSVDPDTLSTDDMDIFRIERIWVNESGQRFAFGHHYLRPHETFHEPSRRFFPNEVFRVPIYEVLPLDTIWRQCWVLDLQTYCKGRPVKALEEHVYICENRVDKTARLFHKISKPKYPLCMKWFAFHVFDFKLRPQRTYTVR